MPSWDSRLSWPPSSGSERPKNRLPGPAGSHLSCGGCALTLPVPPHLPPPRRWDALTDGGREPPSRAGMLRGHREKRLCVSRGDGSSLCWGQLAGVVCSENEYPSWSPSHGATSRSGGCLQALLTEASGHWVRGASTGPGAPPAR